MHKAVIASATIKYGMSMAGCLNSAAFDKYEKPISSETAFKNWLLNTGTVDNTLDRL